MADSANLWSLPVKVEGKPGRLSYDAVTFTVVSASANGTPKRRPTLSTSLRNILWVSVADGVVSLSTLATKSRQHVLVHISARSEAEEAATREWAERLMGLAYDGITPQRRLKVLVNPMGGKGQAKKIFETRVKPIFEAAQCTLDVQLTTHRFHAKEIAESMALDVDAIVTLSGDGLPHEVFNGFASRPDAATAFRVPVVPVPTGSANGFNINIHGIKLGFDVGIAALNAIKGKPMDLDLCSITQGDTRTWSFFSQAIGLMADLDLGTENMRWMGDTRFIVGYLRGILQTRPSPITLKMKVLTSDKQQMLKDLEKPQEPSPLIESSGALPADRYTSEPTDEGDWVTFQKPILYLYGGLQPYVAKDLLQFPMAQPSDGYMDIVVQETASRSVLLGAMDGAEVGSQFWMESQNYYKALAFKIEPKPNSRGLISIDGESYPWKAMYVEVHRGLARTLSPHGHFVSGFVPHNTKASKK